MRIGILTLHHAINYGAFLQCYALQEVLCRQSKDTYVINYRPAYKRRNDLLFYLLRNFSNLSMIGKMKRILFFFLALPFRLMHLDAFYKSTKKNIRFGEKIVFNKKDLESIVGKYNVIVFGSDQIWSPKITEGFEDVYWGDFKFDGKKIAYAVSAGDDFELYFFNVDLHQKLDNFSSISTRELQFMDFLNENYDIGCKKVIDPTLLIEKEYWQKFSDKRHINKRYVLLYAVKSKILTKEIATIISKLLNIIVIEIPADISFFGIFNSRIKLTPEQFVRLFSDAEFVVTSSFHGTCFAINMEKQFISIGEKTNNNKRVCSLLFELGLTHRFVINDDCVENLFYEKINFNDVNKKLCALRKESMQFLSESLEKVI